MGLETILGAFAAGALLSLVDRDKMMTHPQFRAKLEAAGFGIFIPVFFGSRGSLRRERVFSSASTVARIPLFLLAICWCVRCRLSCTGAARRSEVGDCRRAPRHDASVHRCLDQIGLSLGSCRRPARLR